MRIVSARQLNRATLDRQLLLRRESLGVPEAVRRVAALQAQEAASPYLALWNRLTGFDAAELDAAFAERRVVKATLMRVTLHAVHRDDYPFFHEAMLGRLRQSCLGDLRFTSSGLTAADLDALLPDLAAFAAVPRSRVEVEGFLAARLGNSHPGVWWALRRFAPLWHAPGPAAWSFGPRPSFVAADTGARPGWGEAATHLVRRYLAAFGPATAQDVVQFTLLTAPMVREGLEELGSSLVRLRGPDGRELLDLAGASLPDDDAPAPPRLLGMWDSLLLAHKDRGRFIPPEYRPAVIRRNGDVLATLLVDGMVAGAWRPVQG
ncbi:MAG TPA: winged helix DNA-binding domain-containing protein, partial [Deinococcales bacterium]|nr:winged helix DNA-binding domain-containing protein [Deinococcales bacterium]